MKVKKLFAGLNFTSSRAKRGTISHTNPLARYSFAVIPSKDAGFAEEAASILGFLPCTTVSNATVFA